MLGGLRHLFLMGQTSRISSNRDFFESECLVLRSTTVRLHSWYCTVARIPGNVVAMLWHPSEQSQDRPGVKQQCLMFPHIWNLSRLPDTGSAVVLPQSVLYFPLRNPCKSLLMSVRSIHLPHQRWLYPVMCSYSCIFLRTDGGCYKGSGGPWHHEGWANR